MMSKKTYCYVTTGILPFHTPISDVRLLTKKAVKQLRHCHSAHTSIGYHIGNIIM